MSTPDHTSAVETANELVQRAQAAQDYLVLADPADLGKVALDLARTVADLAREVKALAFAVEWQQNVIDGQRTQPASGVPR